MRHGLIGNGCAKPLINWIVESRALRPSWTKQLALSYGSFWFEYLRKEQDRLAGLVNQTRPNFIMGFWRSGTTLLHNHIYAASQSRAPLNWECFNPASFRLRQRPKSDLSVKRPMDEGEISTFSPQEDEFAIMLLGEPSLYRAFLHPSRFAELVDAATHSHDADYPRWTQFLRLLQADSGAPLILKSPNHWLRTNALERAYPAARQVWISRNFNETYASNMNMWGEMALLHALSDWSQSDILEGLRMLTIAYRDKLDSLIVNQPDDIMWIDFDRFKQSPTEQTRDVLCFLRLDALEAGKSDPKVADINVRPHARTASDKLRPPAAIVPIIADINDLHHQAIRRWGVV